MSRILTLLLLGLLLVAAPVAAAEDYRALYQGVATISSPEPFAPVRGNVSITGTATHPQFQRFTLEFAAEPGQNWVFITEGFNQVNNGLLTTWNTQTVPDGTYSLRLRVVRVDGNFDEAIQRGIIVANTAPTATPTPVELPTIPVPAAPTATPTIEATATPVAIEQPEVPTPTPRPSPSPTPEPEAPIETGDEDGGGFLGDSFNLDTLGAAFTRGLTIAGAAFLAVGAFFGVKRLLTWLWYLIAP